MCIKVIQLCCFRLFWCTSLQLIEHSSLYYIKVRVKLLSHVWLFAAPWNVAYQAPTSMEFSRQEYCSGLPFPSPGVLPDPGIHPRSPTLRADALPSEPPGKPSRRLIVYFIYSSLYLLIPNSWFIPPPSLSPLVTINLFSVSVFLFCK